jgi:sec-independent protein translocase protein TatA
MGLGGISPFQLIIILLIVLLLFGGKRLRTLGSDLGSAIKGFRKSMDEQSTKDVPPASLDQKQAQEQPKENSDKSKQQ